MNPQARLDVCPGLVEAPGHPEEGHRQAEMGVGIVRAEAQRVRAMRDSVVQPPGDRQACAAQEIVRLCGIRLEPERLLLPGGRLAGPAIGVQGVAQVDQDPRGMRA